MRHDSPVSHVLITAPTAVVVELMAFVHRVFGIFSPEITYSESQLCLVRSLERIPFVCLEKKYVECASRACALRNPQPYGEQSAASPGQSGSMAPALHSNIAAHPKVRRYGSEEGLWVLIQYLFSTG